MYRQESSERKPLSAPAAIGRLIAFRPWMYVLNMLVWVIFHNVAVVSEIAGRFFYELLEGEANPWSIQAILLLSAGGYLLRAIFIMGGSWVDAEHRFNMRSLLQRNVMRLIFQKPGAELLAVSNGEAVATIRDENETMADIISWSVDCAGNVISLLLALYILLRIDAPLTLAVYASLLVVLALSTRLEHLFEEIRLQAQVASAKIGESIGDVFAAIQGIQVAGAETPVLEHLTQLYATRRSYNLKARIYEILFNGVFYLNFILLTGIILWYAAPKMLQGTITVGALSLFINYLELLTGATLFLGAIIFMYAKSTVALERSRTLVQGHSLEPLVAHLPEPAPQPGTQRELLANWLPEVVAPQREPLELLEVRDLSYSYANGGNGIANISFDIPRGSFTVITGQIASGKSTLLKVLLGLLQLQVGTISWNGKIITEPHLFFVPPQSAYLPQIPVLISASLAENIALGEEYTEEEILAALQVAAFGPDLANMEQGLNTPIGSRGVNLSGGQRQRVATARAIIRQGELLVCDDLSSALDIQTEEALWQNLSQREGTYLIVSHRHWAMRRADQIIVLEEGRMVAKGTWQELLKSSPAFAALWDQREGS
ncbi:MAG: ABC transporter ATP-binding protein/permease [Symbiobacteriaceae bacterium]|nr:ABC transporter ATP-binding protein/permease [Symbiobacteriaceae bacterium]